MTANHIPNVLQRIANLSEDLQREILRHYCRKQMYWAVLLCKHRNYNAIFCLSRNTIESEHRYKFARILPEVMLAANLRQLNAQIFNSSQFNIGYTLDSPTMVAAKPYHWKGICNPNVDYSYYQTRYAARAHRFCKPVVWFCDSLGRKYHHPIESKCETYDQYYCTHTARVRYDGWHFVADQITEWWIECTRYIYFLKYYCIKSWSPTCSKPYHVRRGLKPPKARFWWTWHLDLLEFLNTVD